MFHLKTFVGTVGYLYRERLNFAWQYSRLEEAKAPEKLRAAAQKTASASADVASAAYPDAVFQYVKSEEFMLNSIINKDFGKFHTDYDDDSAFESGLASKTIYLLSRVNVHKSGSRIYVITIPTSAPGGMTALKVTAALAMLFFCVYWDQSDRPDRL